MKSIASIIVLTFLLGTVWGQIHLRDDLDLGWNAINAQAKSQYLDELTPDHKRAYKHFKRWQLANEGELNITGEVFNFAYKTFSEHLTLKKRTDTLQGQGRETHGSWSPVSPTQFTPPHPNNGRVNVIAVHPSNENIVYIGTAIGGLWKSTNAGASWTNLTDGLPLIGVSGIAIHPQNPNVIYILTGDGDGRQIPSIGVLKSYDSGYTWQPTGLMWNESTVNYGYKLIMHPSDANRMFAATKDGLFVTTDGWNTWTELISESMRDIEFKPDDPDILFASSWRFVYKIYKSAISGNYNWTNLSMTNPILPQTDDMTRVAIAVSPDDPDYVYALHAYNVPGGGNGYQGLYVSDSSGSNWILYTDPLNIVGSGDYNQTGWDLQIAADPNNVNRVIVGGINTYESANSGAPGTWESFVSSGVIHADVHDILFTDSYIYIATDGGMARSNDNGQNWVNISNGLDIGQYYDIDILNLNEIIGGTQDNGTIKWVIGNTIGDRTIGADGFECFYHPTISGRIYGSTQDVRMRTNNSGNDWTIIHPPGHGSPWDASWVMHPLNPDRMYAAYTDLARSFDGGSNWEDLNTGFASGKTIRAIAQGVNNPDKMYVSDRKELKRTTTLHNATTYWTNISLGLPFSSSDLGGIAVDPSNADRVWVTFRGYGAGNKVYFSSNSGVTWSNISGSLPNVPVYCITYQAGSNDGLYIGTNIGVFYRNASMTDWIYFSNGLPATRIEDLQIDLGYLYAGTFGRGIWRSELYSSCPVAMLLTSSTDPSSPTNTGVQRYSASHSIASTRIIRGGVGTDVIYRAGNYVRLDPGFEVRAHSLFVAKPGGCPDQ